MTLAYVGSEPAPSTDLVMGRSWRAIAAEHAHRDLVVSVTPKGDLERCTYRQTDERSADLARQLLGLGVTKGARVGILLPNGPDFVVAFLAATRIGAVAVPVNTFFQGPEVGWLLGDADVHTIVTVSEIVGKSMLDRLESAVEGLADCQQAPLHLPAAPNLRHVICLDAADRPWVTTGSSAVSTELLAAAEDAVRPADDLFVIYTSGSTANPKGAIHTHGPALAHSRLIATVHDWTCADRIYVPMGFFWVGGLVYGVLGPLQLGATVLTEHRFEPAAVLKMLAAEKVTYATGWPHVGPALSNHPDFLTADLSTLRGGYQETLLPPERRSADPTLKVRWLGMTETCSAHTWWPPHVELPASKRGSLGVSAPGFEHQVVGTDGTPVADGERGEIWVRGYALMRGFVGRSRGDVLDADGWYHTGDAAHRDADGHLYFAGRMDDLIKTAGANVSPMEVESTLGVVPGVRVAYVVGIPDEQRGATVTAVVVTDVGTTIEPDDLRAWCKERLAAYKVPKRWIVLDSPDPLPYTTTNKLDRRRLVNDIDEVEAWAADRSTRRRSP